MGSLIFCMFIVITDSFCYCCGGDISAYCPVGGERRAEAGFDCILTFLVAFTFAAPFVLASC